MNKQEAIAALGDNISEARRTLEHWRDSRSPWRDGGRAEDAICALALCAIDDAGDEELRQLREDRTTLLLAIQDAIDKAADTNGVGDWPPDAVLGEAGVDAMRAAEGARHGLQVTLALPQFEDAKRVIRDERARLKEWRKTRRAELEAKMAAIRAAKEQS